MSNSDKKCVWLFIQAWIDESGGDYIKVLAYSSRDDARKEMKTAVENVKAEWDGLDAVIEEGEDDFSIYEEGSYSECHFNARVECKEVL